MYETYEEPEKSILVGVCTESDESAIRYSMDELYELLKTAGGVKVGELIQNRESFHPATYIGKGKLEELKALVEYTQADSCICDDELSPAQMRNLSEYLGVKVIDRTVLILDIFAQHAQTSEGKLQVELAQLNYNSSHLIGSYSRMSRLGGGIGTRGPGEQKIEIDRRVIRNRITQIKRELEKIEKNREEMRKKRSENKLPVIAIVGYTNAGKSTLLNRLTDASVLSEDKLFATLDPTTRKYTYEDGEEVLFTDTVGFVSKLPHHLINAFRSTLKEAGYADIILHVADSSNPDLKRQMITVNDTLKGLSIESEIQITAFNKIDKIENPEDFMYLKDLNAQKYVKISALTGVGVEELLEVVKDALSDRYVTIDKVYSYQDASKIAILREKGALSSEEYTAEGIHVTGLIAAEFVHLI